jgi:hypothetical protein
MLPLPAFEGIMALLVLNVSVIIKMVELGTQAEPEAINL